MKKYYNNNNEENRNIYKFEKKFRNLSNYLSLKVNNQMFDAEFGMIKTKHSCIVNILIYIKILNKNKKS